MRLDKSSRPPDIATRGKGERKYAGKEERSRGELYSVLACKLGIPKEDCHFGHFNEEQLKRAWQIIKEPNWWR